MRRIVRGDLPSRVRHYLERKQREVDSGRPAKTVWKRARKTKAMRTVRDQLARMAGKRERCMFCLDSRGVDIDHFWPQSTYPALVFCWENLLLVCSGCNRPKLARFELDAQGSPMLIDPTQEDPWDRLFYDSRTGIITARFLSSGEPDPRGQYTVERSGLPLNIEAVTEGRLRTQRHLQRCVERFLGPAGAVRECKRLKEELISCINDSNDYGLGEWFFLRDGRDEPGFTEIRQRFPSTWATLEARLTGDTGAGR